jgi:poly-gamma-glutamate synthesis protein (capsule biosynthesis protein)
MLAGEWGRPKRAATLAQLRAAVPADDLVFANLETALPGNEGVIDKQPRVLGSPALLRRHLRALGVDLVNLANNHVFDAHQSGFTNLRSLLDEDGIRAFGAGTNDDEAAEPCIIERHGVRLGWLGYVAPSTQPSHLAGPGRGGVNALDEARVIADVRRLAADVDHVVMSLHWGIEYCHVPGPDQIRFARAVIDAGATLVLGHHAHVVQGIETYGRGAIAYNLGNAATTHFDIDERRAIQQSRRTRSSVLLRARFTATELSAIEVLPFRMHGDAVLLDDPYARRVFARAQRRLAAGVGPRRWRARRLFEDVILRTLWKLDPRVVRSVNGRHLRKPFRNLAASFGGHGPVS